MSQKVNLKELDFNNIGNWPQKAKMVFCVFLTLLILGLSYLLVIRGKVEELEGLEGKESTLRTQFETEQKKAVNLEPLKQQLAQMDLVLQQMLRQLPSKTEMPELLIDISQTAQAAGLESDLFQPGPETPKDFYAEKPIALRFTGTYHQFGTFISGVASLPRVVILTLHDVSLTPKSPGKDGTASGQLVLQGTVKTYRYLDDEESAAASKGKKAGGAK